MVYTSRMFGTIPIIATILPVNPDGPFAYNQFRVDMYNDEIRAMAQAEQVHLVDLNALAWAYGDISALFCDWGHPNEIGTDLIADAFYDAVKSYD
jgi:lysophospholipase L1-like esterase